MNDYLPEAYGSGRRHFRCARVKVKLKRFPQVDDGFFFRVPLACHIHVEALRQKGAILFVDDIADFLRLHLRKDTSFFREPQLFDSVATLNLAAEL